MTLDQLADVNMWRQFAAQEKQRATELDKEVDYAWRCYQEVGVLWHEAASVAEELQRENLELKAQLGFLESQSIERP